MQKTIGAQFQIWFALTLREMQGLNASLRYSYAWTLLQVLITLGALIVLRVVIRGFAPPNMPPVIFIVTGAIPYFTFYSTFSSVEIVITRNKRLLSLPMITPLDLAVANAIRIFCTYGVLFILLAVVSSYYEASGWPKFLPGVILLDIAAALIGFFFGLILMPLTRVFPPASQLLHFFWRFGIFISGVFILLSSIPEWVWPYLTWNPMLHICELMRTYWFGSYRTPVESAPYVAECLVGLAVLGLSIERFSRRRIPP